jgi:choline dehydrogenase-like flavoprotein
MFCLIGSGPAAIAAAVALTEAGRPVTILDAGKTLEPEREKVLTRLSAQEPESWDAGDLQFLRGGDQKTRHGKIHSKLVYGSTYPYEDAAEPLVADLAHVPFNYSMARGGLSNVWGASLLPVHEKDIADWPITLRDLEPHYDAVLDFMPSTAVDDALQDLLPRHTQRDDPLRPSRQAEAFLRDLQQHRPRLEKRGIHFGKSRMAVTASNGAGHECVYCGLCLYGCPYSLIYSAAHTLDHLIRENKVTYLHGQVAEKVESSAGGVTIHTRNVGSRVAETFRAERVFVGAGVLPTASLALQSLDGFNTPVTLLDSQYFIYPFLRFAQTAGVERETLHSLAQLFLEIDDPRVSRHLVHIEVFTYSDFLRRALLQTPLRFVLGNRWTASHLFGSLLVLQCFLHSHDSGSLTIELRRDSAGSAKLHIAPHPNGHAFRASIKAGLKLAASAFALRGVPVVPAIQFAEPGRSYHCGGTFPMRAKPSRFETDILGQLPELERVHLIDASVFPSIPATTITLTVMANAHRIAAQAAEL